MLAFEKADIVPGLTAKQPKVVAGCVTAMKEIVRYDKQGRPSVAHHDVCIR